MANTEAELKAKKKYRKAKNDDGLTHLNGVYIHIVHNDYLKKHGLKPKVVEYIASLVEQHKKEGGKDE